MAVNRIAAPHRHCPRHKMSNDLVAKQVKIDPVIRTSPFGTANYPPVKAPRRRQIIDRKSQVEWP